MTFQEAREESRLQGIPQRARGEFNKRDISDPERVFLVTEAAASLFLSRRDGG